MRTAVNQLVRRALTWNGTEGVHSLEESVLLGLRRPGLGLDKDDVINPGGTTQSEGRSVGGGHCFDMREGGAAEEGGRVAGNSLYLCIL